MRIPILFLSKFVLVSVVLFAFWEPISKGYLIVLSAFTNAVVGLFTANVHFEVRDGLFVVYHGIAKKDVTFLAQDYDAIYFNMVITVALFAATPGLQLLQKIKYTAIALPLLFLSHVFLLYMVSYTCIWSYINGLIASRGRDAPQVQILLRTVDALFPLKRGFLFLRLFDLWTNWGRLAVPFLIWLIFVQRQLSQEGGFLTRIAEFPSRPPRVQARKT